MCTECRTLEVEMDAQREQQRRTRKDAVSVHPDTNLKRLTP